MLLWKRFSVIARLRGGGHTEFSCCADVATDDKVEFKAYSFFRLDSVCTVTKKFVYLKGQRPSKHHPNGMKKGRHWLFLIRTVSVAMHMSEICIVHECDYACWMKGGVSLMNCGFKDLVVFWWLPSFRAAWTRSAYDALPIFSTNRIHTGSAPLYTHGMLTYFSSNGSLWRRRWSKQIPRRRWVWI